MVNGEKTGDVPMTSNFYEDLIVQILKPFNAVIEHSPYTTFNGS